MDKEFWDVPTLKELVKKKYKVGYRSDFSYRTLLHYCGFSYQRVEFVDKHQDAQEAEGFKKKYVT